MGILILAEETIHEDTKCVMDITMYIKQHKDTSSEKRVDMKLIILF